MVHIISKKDGPRREDVAAKRLIQENRATIEGLANQFSGGGYSQMVNQRKQQNSPPSDKPTRGLYAVGHHTRVSTGQYYVRISLNGRVVVVDEDTRKQLHFLGELRSKDGDQKFVLASQENNFFAPLDDDICKQLKDFDGKVVDADFTEEMLSAELHEKLELG